MRDNDDKPGGENLKFENSGDSYAISATRSGYHMGSLNLNPEYGDGEYSLGVSVPTKDVAAARIGAKRKSMHDNFQDESIEQVARDLGNIDGLKYEEISINTLGARASLNNAELILSNGAFSIGGSVRTLTAYFEGEVEDKYKKTAVRKVGERGRRIGSENGPDPEEFADSIIDKINEQTEP